MSAVAFMDARSIAATAANGGAITSAEDPAMKDAFAAIRTIPGLINFNRGRAKKESL